MGGSQHHEELFFFCSQHALHWLVPSDSNFVMLSLNRDASSWPSACTAAQNPKLTDEQG